MKLKLALTVLFTLLLTAVNAQTTTEKSEKKIEEVTFYVGMHCQGCKDRIEKNIPMERGVKDLKVDLEKKEVTVIFNPRKTNVEKLKKAITELGYSCELPQSSKE